MTQQLNPALLLIPVFILHMKRPVKSYTGAGVLTPTGTDQLWYSCCIHVVHD